MLVTEIGNNPCKIGRTSITIKNPETGKTMGIVRDVLTFGEAQKQFRRLFDWRQKQRVTPDILSRVVEADGICYSIVNKRNMDFLTENANRWGWTESDKQSYTRKMEEIETAKAAGLTVLWLNLV